MSHVFVVALALPSLLFINAKAADTNRTSNNFIYDAGGHGRAGAVTASARGSTALLYNPSQLARNDEYSLQVFGMEGAVDDKSYLMSSAGGRYNGSALDATLKRLTEGNPFRVQASLKLFDLVLPYFSTHAFSSFLVDVERTKKSDSDAVSARVTNISGPIMGFGIPLGRLSVGYSLGLLGMSEVHTTSTIETLAAMQNRYDSGEDVDAFEVLKDDTSFQYGSGMMHNAGFSFRLIGGSTDDIFELRLAGATLNIGGTKFSSSVPALFYKLAAHEKKLKERITEAGIATDTPEPLLQTTQLATSLMLGKQAEAGAFAQFSFELQDVENRRRFVTSQEAGFNIPYEHALKFIVFVLGQKKTKEQFDIPLHIGLLGASGFSGYVPKEKYLYGGRVSLHLGVAGIVSLIKLNAEFYREKKLDASDDTVTAMRGAKYSVGLCFIF